MMNVLHLILSALTFGLVLIVGQLTFCKCADLSRRKFWVGLLLTYPLCIVCLFFVVASASAMSGAGRSFGEVLGFFRDQKFVMLCLAWVLLAFSIPIGDIANHIAKRLSRKKNFLAR